MLMLKMWLSHCWKSQERLFFMTALFSVVGSTFLFLEECGGYLETLKVYENKSADLIQGQMDTDYLSRLSHALTSVRHVNETDVVTLGSTFGILHLHSPSLTHIMDASMEDLAHCPGIGERKVKRLCDTFHEPFKLSIP